MPFGKPSITRRSPGGPTTVLIADDHALMRGGIRAILESSEGITVVGEAKNGQEAVELASIYAPDIVLMDISMPLLNGLEASRKISASDDAIAIIGLTMHSDERFVTGMLDAGARGYLLKTCDAGELVRAIEAVGRGQFYITSELTHVLIAWRRTRGSGEGTGTHAAGAPPCDALSAREREVLQLVAEGFTSKAIGVRLGIVKKTVDSHRTHIGDKLGLHSVAELTKYAVREGLTGLGG